jgi:hypothetical protein
MGTKCHTICESQFRLRTPLPLEFFQKILRFPPSLLTMESPSHL